MNTKNTASQPKVASIGDDTQFRRLLGEFAGDRYNGTDGRPARKNLIAYLDSKLRAPADQAASVVGGVDWLGLALDLEDKAKRVESQHVERAMKAGAHGLRLMGAQQSLAPAATVLGYQIKHSDFRHYSGAVVPGRTELQKELPNMGYFQGCTDLVVTPLAAAEGQVSAAAPELPDDDEIACDCCGLLMGESRLLSQIGDAKRASEGQAQTSAAVESDLTTVDCPTCNGHGLIGGHCGQTPESYEEHAEGCDDCDGQGKIIVSKRDLAAQSADKPMKEQQ